MFSEKRKHKNQPVKFYWGNNNTKPRLNWKQMEPQGGTGVVKGLSRRVIVIKSPDAQYFEEAIFVLKDEIFGGGKDSAAILKEARKVANGYIQINPKPQKKSGTKFPPKLFAIAGAGLTALICLAQSSIV